MSTIMFKFTGLPWSPDLEQAAFDKWVDMMFDDVIGFQKAMDNSSAYSLDNPHDINRMNDLIEQGFVSPSKRVDRYE